MIDTYGRLGLLLGANHPSPRLLGLNLATLDYQYLPDTPFTAFPAQVRPGNPN